MTYTHSDIPLDLMIGMFKARKRFFVDRLGWNLDGSYGVEVDDYDNKDSYYIITDTGTSCRIRPLDKPNMIDDYFPQFVVDQGLRDNCWEITRFMGTDVEALTQQLDQFRKERGLLGYVGIVFSPTLRLLDRKNTNYRVLSEDQDLKLIFLF